MVSWQIVQALPRKLLSAGLDKKVRRRKQLKKRDGHRTYPANKSNTLRALGHGFWQTRT